MPVPSSGQLRLRADINQEINGNDTDDNVSLGMWLGVMPTHGIAGSYACPYAEFLYDL